jgi:hypothetical protein
LNRIRISTNRLALVEVCFIGFDSFPTIAFFLEGSVGAIVFFLEDSVGAIVFFDRVGAAGLKSPISSSKLDKSDEIV